MRHRTLTALAALLAIAPAVAAPPTPAPLAKPAMLRMPDMPLHDPWIVADRKSGTYYLYTKNDRRMTGDAGIGIMAYTSRDLKTWTKPRVVFTLPKGLWANDGAWAPEVHRWRGRWYLFATFYNDSVPIPATDQRRPVRRSTLLAVSNALTGPFTLVRNGEPLVDKSLMSLDGTLYVDPAGKPWLVYAHEWVQVGDGTIEAIPLDDNLRAVGPPRLLFKASDAPWVPRKAETNYVTDGPELIRTRTGTLLMLWSSYDANGYVQSIARSRSGSIEGPWEQLPPLVRADSGHGMIFRRFDGTLMMVLHRPFQNARGKLYEMRDASDNIAVVREATELDGERHPTD
jgi:beta-xylosidase